MITLPTDAIDFRHKRENILQFLKEPPWTQKDIELLREKVHNDKKLKSRTDDEFLLRFLRARKFDQERAFKMLKNYYSTKKKYPEVFTNFSPSSSLEALKDNFLMYTAEVDSRGRHIAIGRASAWDVSKVSLMEIIRIAHMFLEEVIREEIVQINGFILILDAKGLSARHMLQLTPRMVFTIINVFLDSFPVRYKEIHVLNTSRLVDLVVAAFWPFLPTKFKQRISFHHSLESLHSAVDAKILPVEYGGEGGSFDNSLCVQRLLLEENYLREQEKFWRKLF